MRVKNLYVVDAIIPMDVISSRYTAMESAYGKNNCICKKVEQHEKDGQIKRIYYQQLENNSKIHQTNELGINRVNGTPIPLSDYYYSFLGIKKFNNHQNKKEVYKNVKKLRKKGIL